MHLHSSVSAEMSGGKYLLLQLAGLVLLGGYQGQTVSMFPNFKQIYIGDLISLRCPSQGEDKVTWFRNNEVVPEWKDKNLTIPVVARKHSGTYHCKGNGVTSSKNITIKVQDHYPRASLILKTGQPVMRTEGSVTLRLDNDKGLLGWRCYVFKEKQIWLIKLKSVNDSESFEFQPYKLVDSETIFWCTNADRSQRSNQVVIRTSDKDVAMEMYFAPAVPGDALTLRCFHWDMEKISNVNFYKNNELIKGSSRLTHNIRPVSEADEGDYKCSATLANKGLQVSDVQHLFIREETVRAVVSEEMGLSCSCLKCPRITDYIWYKVTEDSQPLVLPGNNQSSMKPDKNGIYACTAVWDSGRALISRGHAYNPAGGSTVIIIVCMILVLVVLFLVAYFCVKKRNERRSNTGPLYEDVMMKSKEDDRYEKLRGRDAQKESEYESIQPAETHHGKKEGDYQPLEKAETTEGVYHTLEMEGEQSKVAAGGYEALQRKTMKGEIYHTLGMEGAASGEQN